MHAARQKPRRVREQLNLSNSRRDRATGQIRVIGIFAHVDAGKTTTSEGILYYTGRIHRLGRVDEGNTQLDWMVQERERGITVTSAATTCAWRDHQINLIDTPGHIDFSAEVMRSIRVIDGAVMVLCGVGGVEAQTETVWMHADREGAPRVIFVNKLDRQGADFDRVLAEVQERLTPRAVPLQLPIGCEGDFSGVVDLIDQRAWFWQPNEDELCEGEVPSDLAAQATLARGTLVEAICETDDALLGQWLEGKEPDPQALRTGLRRATLAGELVPVVCGAALRRIGIQSLLDAVVSYLPSPLDRPSTGAWAGKVNDPDAPLCATAFKIVKDPYVGHVTWVRVLSGRLQSGEMVLNPRTQVQERVGRIYRMHADKREQVGHMAAGDVVALAGIRSAGTGDTLCDPTHPVEVAAFSFPEPVIQVALTPASDEEQERLFRAVDRLCEEDPTLVGQFDPETNERTLAGMGELHLEVAIDRLRTEFGLVPRVSDPEVSHLETVRRQAEATGSYIRQSGGHGHYARVHLRLEPLPRSEGVVFVNATLPSEVPTDFIRPTELGVREALEKGIRAGYPITDVRVTFVGGRAHVIDSAGKDFWIAGSMAVRQAVRRARPALLEPVMRVDVTMGEDHLGAVTGDLGRRRGRVEDIQVRGQMRHVTGEVPLLEVRGYATELRSMTGGRCSFTLEFRRYDLVPETLSEVIIRKRRLAGKISDR